MHQVKRFVDVFQAHGMGDERVQRDLAGLRHFHVAWQFRPAAHATEGRTAPDAPGHQLEWTRGNFLAGAGQEISTRPFQLVTGRVWRGSAFGGVRGRTELPSYVEMAQTGEIPLDTFITHTMGLEDINKAFDLMHEGKSIRTVIHF